ncbi:SDR family oxidoreductase [Pseudomonas defluvii]|uniref:SDR family oxidoreductase n=1 Tax=Pseudomonas defluvii TaxID=1876757 RepID=UPI003906C17A
MLLKDKVVIVSGIGPGLGIKLAVRAAEFQAKAVVLAARTPAKLDQAEKAIRDAGYSTPILKVPTDIAQAKQCQRLADLTIEHFGQIDILINSAYAHGAWGSASESSMDDWRKAMDVNLFGTMQMTQAVLPQMKKQKAGSIVMINTMATRTPNQLESGYAVSKGALKTAVQYLAQDLGPYGIRVNSTFMGWMWGAPVIGYFESEAKRRNVPMASLVDEVAQQIALRKIPEDNDCAMVALYLASDYAKVITGAQLDANGGHFLPY